MLNSFVCSVKKNVLTNKIVGFGGLNIIFLVILSELIVNP